jgi:hypothetical protein
LNRIENTNLDISITYNEVLYCKYDTSNGIDSKLRIVIKIKIQYCTLVSYFYVKTHKEHPAEGASMFKHELNEANVNECMYSIHIVFVNMSDLLIISFKFRKGRKKAVHISLLLFFVSTKSYIYAG